MGFTDVVQAVLPTRKVRVGTRSSYTLTEAGKVKVETFALDGVSFKVAADLDENGASRLAEISERTGIKTDKVQDILHRLISWRYVMVIDGAK
jgi:hypothetical protein